MYKYSDLILHGRLGAIYMGCPVNLVHDVLGKPNDVSVSKKPLIYKYGILEMHIDFEESSRDKIVYGFSILFDQMYYHHIPTIFQRFDWFPCNFTSPNELEKYLAEHHLTWDALPRKWGDDEILDYYAGAAAFVFDSKKLASVSVNIARCRPCPTDAPPQEDKVSNSQNAKN